MRETTKNRILCLLFGGFLLAMGALFLFAPKEAFSPREKRYLTEAPRAELGEILSGRFGRQAESWAADQLPGRNFFLNLSAEADRWENLQVTKEIYRGKSGRLYESPAAYDEAEIRRNMAALNAFAETVAQPVDLALVPSAGFWMAEDIPGLADPYEDEAIVESAYGLAAPGIRPLNLIDSFREQPEKETLYYRTDHHWTSLGAYTAYRGYMESKGRACPKPEDYRVETVEGFYGTTYARACFWNLPAESLELWDSGGTYTVRFSERDEEYTSLFFPERLQEADKYPVWLDGNHPLVTITNHDPAAQGKLLVIRDSYANCLGCFLADSYAQVTLADLRYYKQPVSELCKEEGFDDILFLYSVGNFMRDSNIVWLK